MTIRLASAFATHRTAVIESLKASITKELVPNFNAEIENIRRVFEEEKDDLGESTAIHCRRGRIMDLKVRQQQFIDSLNADLFKDLKKRVEEYKGKMIDKTITDGKSGKEKLVHEAEFPDGSTARVPNALWVDYTVFHRV